LKKFFLVLLLMLIVIGLKTNFFEVKSNQKNESFISFIGIVKLNLTNDFPSGSPVPADIDGDNILEIVFPTFHAKIFAVDPTNLSYEMLINLSDIHPGSSIDIQPCVADIDNDGHVEIVLFTWEEYVVAYDYVNRKIDWIYNEINEVTSEQNSFSVTNVDDDKFYEIIIFNYDSVYCIDGLNGTLSWKLNLTSFLIDYLNASDDIIGYIESKPVIVDYNNDKSFDIMVMSGICINEEASLFFIILNGTDGKPIVIRRHKVRSLELIRSCNGGDIDGDFVPEIVRENLGIIRVFNISGYVVKRIELPGEYPFTTGIILGDADNDSKDEMFCTTWEYAVGIDDNGTIMWKSEIPWPPWYNVRPILVDANGDNVLDLIVPSRESLLFFDGLNGTLLEVFNLSDYMEKPMAIIGTPCAADFDGDGYIEIAFVTGNSVVILKTSGRKFSWYAYAGDCMGHANALLLVDPRTFSLLRPSPEAPTETPEEEQQGSPTAFPDVFLVIIIIAVIIVLSVMILFKRVLKRL